MNQRLAVWLTSFATIAWVGGLATSALAAGGEPKEGAKTDEVTVTGCLAKGEEAGTYRLTNATGGEAQEYEIVGGEKLHLSDHVGHKVDVTGRLKSPKAAHGATGEAGEAGETAHTHLKITAMKHVAATCP
jgi:hypothetical protein